MQIFNKIPIQRHGPRKSFSASHLLQKSGQQQKTTLEKSVILFLPHKEVILELSAWINFFVTASSMSCLTWKTNKMSIIRHKIPEISHYRGRRNLTANRGWLRSNKEIQLIDVQQRRKKPGENMNSGHYRSMFKLARRREKYYSHLFLDIFQQFLSHLLVWKPRKEDRTLFTTIINRKTAIKVQ